ncbi:hypothetical protein MNBD_GAMMA02-709 [hydrothermal vent metagenome]|uniref:DUF4340 domain-containing protein n=1 Tax=hydrothermal vent metagenome TaxID=652676 RepID=A0A3B0W6Q2_9ZZZZ
MLSKMKVLTGLLIVMAGLAYWVLQSQNNSDADQQQLLIPAWQQDEAQIRAIDQLILAQGGEQLVLTKTGDMWQLNNGFYASIDPLFDLIQSLKTAEIIEAKTANPARHAQLELADDDLLVSLYQADQLQHTLHVGKKSTADLTFVRRAGEDQTYTVKGLKAVSFNPDSWALKTVVDIAGEDVQAVTLTSADGELITVNRNPESGVLQLADIPEGFQLQTNAYLDQLVGGLSRLMIDEAVPAESWPAATTDVAEVPAHLSATYQLNSGTVINIDVYQQDDAYFLTIDSVQYPQYDGWVMKIAEYKFKALNRQLIEFIEPVQTQNQSIEQSTDGAADNTADKPSVE